MLILQYFWPVKQPEIDLLSSSASFLLEVHLSDPHGPLPSKNPPEAIALVNVGITKTITESKKMQ